jgi:hypothetical protein
MKIIKKAKKSEKMPELSELYADFRTILHHDPTDNKADYDPVVEMFKTVAKLFNFPQDFVDDILERIETTQIIYESPLEADFSLVTKNIEPDNSIKWGAPESDCTLKEIDKKRIEYKDKLFDALWQNVDSQTSGMTEDAYKKLMDMYK